MIDLDAIEVRIARVLDSVSPFVGGYSRRATSELLADIPALVAEVRRLRAALTEMADRVCEWDCHTLALEALEASCPTTFWTPMSREDLTKVGREVASCPTTTSENS